VAKLLHGFGARPLFTASGAVATSRGAERCELEVLLAASDFVSLNVPLTPRTGT